MTQVFYRIFRLIRVLTLITVSYPLLILSSCEESFYAPDTLSMTTSVNAELQRHTAHTKRKPSLWTISTMDGTSINDLHFSLNNPVLTAKDVTDVDADFVADPFIIMKDGLLYMFFEILDHSSKKGVIGYATSLDTGKIWKYQKVIMDKPWHQSFPHVFENHGDYYMLPEAKYSGSTVLYKATGFPEDWSQEIKILNIPLTDPVIFKKEEVWYLFGTYKENLLLLYSEYLDKEWKPHPVHTIVKGDSRCNRSGGEIYFDGTDYYRIAQDGLYNYGTRIHIYKILKIDTRQYKEVLVPDNKNLCEGKYMWAKRGIHTLNMIASSDKKLIAVIDGH